MIHLLTMTCTISERSVTGAVTEYNKPVHGSTGTVGVKCLYLSASDTTVEQFLARGVAVAGKLYVMADVDIQDGYHVKSIAKSGVAVDSDEFEVVKVKDELAPAGRHHQVAYLQRAEPCK